MSETPALVLETLQGTVSSAAVRFLIEFRQRQLDLVSVQRSCYTAAP